jgi:hypothetical protein
MYEQQHYHHSKSQQHVDYRDEEEEDDDGGFDQESHRAYITQQLQHLKQMQDHINELSIENGHNQEHNGNHHHTNNLFSSDEVQEDSETGKDGLEHRIENFIPQSITTTIPRLNVQLVSSASDYRDLSTTPDLDQQNPEIIRYQKKIVTQQKANFTTLDHNLNHTDESVARTTAPPVPTPLLQYVPTAAVKQQENTTVPQQQQQQFPSFSNILSDLESLIDRKMQVMRSEFSGELQKLKQENNTLQQKHDEEKKTVPLPIPTHVAIEEQNISKQKDFTLDFEEIDQDENDDALWMKELVVFLKEENEFLKDTLTAKEKEIDLTQKAMVKLTDENIVAYETIQKLTEELKRMQDAYTDLQSDFMSLRKQHEQTRQIQQLQTIVAPPPVLKTSSPDDDSQFEDDLHSFSDSRTHLSAIIDNMSNLEQSLTNRKIGSWSQHLDDDEDFARLNLPVPPDSKTRVSPKKVTQRISNTPNNTPLVKSFSFDSNPSSSDRKRSKTPPTRSKTPPLTTKRSTTPTNTKSPGNTKRSTTPNKTSGNRSSGEGANKQKLDSMAERLLRSLRGGQPEINTREIDRMVEELKQEFERIHSIVLPLRKLQDNIYLLGSNSTGRKLHLNVINTPVGKQLVVRLGGGYRDLLECLSKSIVKIAKQ